MSIEMDDDIINTSQKKKATKSLDLWNMEVDQELNFPAKYLTLFPCLSSLNKYTPRTYKIIEYSRRAKITNAIDGNLVVKRIN